jgi:hypothetical protein
VRGTAPDEFAGVWKDLESAGCLDRGRRAVWFVTGVVGGRRMGFRLLAANIFERVAGSQEHGGAGSHCFKKNSPGGKRSRPTPPMPHNAPTAPLARFGELSYAASMSQDHYVAQTYLEKWCDPTNRDHLHVYRKSNLKYFPARPYDVCREKDGDKTPGYLADESALGKFRGRFEPTWNQALAAAVQRRITDEDKFFISGYWANLTATTPTTQGLGVDLLISP